MNKNFFNFEIIKALKCINILIDCGERGVCISYAKLAEMIGEKNVRHVGRILEKADLILNDVENKLHISVPFLASLVYNQMSGVPGVGIYKTLARRNIIIELDDNGCPVDKEKFNIIVSCLSKFTLSECKKFNFYLIKNILN